MTKADLARQLRTADPSLSAHRIALIVGMDRRGASRALRALPGDLGRPLTRQRLPPRVVAGQVWRARSGHSIGRTVRLLAVNGGYAKCVGKRRSLLPVAELLKRYELVEPAEGLAASDVKDAHRRAG